MIIKKNPDSGNPPTYLYLSPVFPWRYLSRHIQAVIQMPFLSHSCALQQMWLYFSCVSCHVSTIRTFPVQYSLHFFSIVRDTDGVAKFHSIAFFLPMQFFTEVRTNSDSSRCYGLSISVKRLYCTTFAPYKSLLGFSSFTPHNLFSFKATVSVFHMGRAL